MDGFIKMRVEMHMLEIVLDACTQSELKLVLQARGIASSSAFALSGL